MAKITELPKATSVNDTDIAVIVQDGETKQVPKSVFAPTVPIDTEMSETSENPVQNKVAKTYIDEKTKATPTDITLTDNLLQLTANGKAVGAGVTLPSGLRLINRITVAGGETANVMKISTDENGNPFELSEAFFTAHFVFEPVSVTNAAIRVRTDGGQRYIVIKPGVSLSNGIITCSGTINAHGGILTTSAVYSTTDNPQAADTVYGMISKANSVAHNLKNIEAFILISGQLELKEGSFLELWGC